MNNEFVSDVYEMSSIDGNLEFFEESDRNAAEVFARLMKSASSSR